MPSQSGSPTSVSEGVGGLAWANPTNVEVQDDTGASVTGGVSKTLTCTTYGLSVPGTATITGVEVLVRRRNADNTAVDALLRLVKHSTGPVGDDKADGVTGWPTNYASRIYGSSSDLWGTTWTPADVNHADFGLAFAADGGLSSASADVDFLGITVYYTTGGSDSFPRRTPEYPMVFRTDHADTG